MAANNNVTGGFKASPNLLQRRKEMKYKISTSSTTAKGVVPIQGVNKYPAQPTIHFTREAWVKQCHLVDKCTKEVGWFALVDYDEDNNIFTISEIVVPAREVTAAETNIGKEDLADAAMELIEAGKDTSKMYAWFHSHVNMGVSPSAQDEYQVEDFLEDLADQPEIPAFIRGIQNKKGDLKIDVYYVQHGIAYQNLDFYVIHDDDPQWLIDIEDDIKTKVLERTYTPYNQYNNKNATGGFGGSRQNAGKSESVARNANIRDIYDNDYLPGRPIYNNGFRGYGGYYDYDEEENDYYVSSWGVGNTVDTNDSPFTPKATESLNDAPELFMELVYSAKDENVEVYLDDDGKLWVCDENNKLYDYQEYTEAYGEIDASRKIKVS